MTTNDIIASIRHCNAEDSVCDGCPSKQEHGCYLESVDVADHIEKLQKEIEEAKRLLHGFCAACVHSKGDDGFDCEACKWNFFCGSADCWEWIGAGDNAG